MSSVSVRIGNSTSTISGLNAEQYSSLRQVLSYAPNPTAAYFSGASRRHRNYLINIKGQFPTGLLYLVQKWADDTRLLPALILDTRVKPESEQLYKMTSPPPPYPEQEGATLAGYTCGRGTIVMPTGTGKSLTMALLINKLQVRTLIVVPTLHLKYQLQQTFESLFEDTTGITIENIDSPRLKSLKGFDCLIIDEAHHVASRTYRRLNRLAWDGIYHRYFFTATPFRTNAEENILFTSIAGQVIYTLPYKLAVERGYIQPVEAYYIELGKTKTDARVWANVYSDLVVNNKERNKIIASLIKKLDNTPTLCLVKEIKHGENILALLDTQIPFVQGENEDNREIISKFNSEHTKILIGTTGVLGEGVDTKPAEYIIIAGLGKSRGQFQQQIGRGLRKFGNKTSCKVIIFKDSSHRWTLNHFKAQVKYLREEYGVVPVKLEL